MQSTSTHLFEKYTDFFAEIYLNHLHDADRLALLQVDKRAHTFFLKTAQTSFISIQNVYDQTIVFLEKYAYHQKAQQLKMIKKNSLAAQSLPTVSWQYLKLVESLPPIIYDIDIVKKKALNDQINSLAYASLTQKDVLKLFNFPSITLELLENWLNYCISFFASQDEMKTKFESIKKQILNVEQKANAHQYYQAIENMVAIIFFKEVRDHFCILQPNSLCAEMNKAMLKQLVKISAASMQTRLDIGYLMTTKREGLAFYCLKAKLRDEISLIWHSCNCCSYSEEDSQAFYTQSQLLKAYFKKFDKLAVPFFTTLLAAGQFIPAYKYMHALSQRVKGDLLAYIKGNLEPELIEKKTNQAFHHSIHMLFGDYCMQQEPAAQVALMKNLADLPLMPNECSCADMLPKHGAQLEHLMSI